MDYTQDELLKLLGMLYVEIYRSKTMLVQYQKQLAESHQQIIALEKQSQNIETSNETGSTG